MGGCGTKPKKACALVMTNSFPSKDWELPGCEQDFKIMVGLLKDKLKCKCFGYKNLSAQEMKKRLKDFSQQSPEKYEYLVVVISTHGNLVNGSHWKKKHISQAQTDPNGVVVFYGNDGYPLLEKDMLNSFNPENAKKLRNIPKIFILDYCRGEREFHPPAEWTPQFFEVSRSEDLPSRFPLASMEDFPKALACVSYGASSFAGDADAYQNPPIVAFYAMNTAASQMLGDVSYAGDIVVYPTQHYYVSWTGNEDGSLLILAIKNVFQQYWDEKRVVDMMTMVNKWIMKEGHDLYHQMSSFESSLTEPLYLYEK